MHRHAPGRVRRGRMNKALAGLLVALTLGVGLAVGVVAGGIISPDAPPVAGRDRVKPRRPRRPPPRRSDGLADTQRIALADASRALTAPPSPTPEPTPPRPGAADRAARQARVASAPRDRGDDRRPVRRATAVRPELGRRRVAGARRRRHPALHGPVPGRQPQGRGPRPQLALLLHRVGLRVALGLRPRRRLAAGAGAAPLVEGQGPGGVRRRRVPLRGPLPVADQHPVRAAQRVHGRARTCGRWARRSAPKPVDVQAALEVRARQAARRCGRRAARSSSPTSPTRSPTSTTARRTPTCGR